jgi:hypothetical protein
MVCFAKHILDPKQIRPDGPEASLFSIFFLIGSDPARTRYARPSGHWSKPVTRLVTACLRELFTHALHRVIIFLKGWKTKAYLCSRERSRR